MDPNYHVNRIMQSKAKQQYFVGSSRRQYGSGLGSAIRLGVRAFVLPAIKHYGIPIAKQFLKSAAPEFLDVVQGKTKVKNALKMPPRLLLESNLEEAEFTRPENVQNQRNKKNWSESYRRKNHPKPHRNEEKNHEKLVRQRRSPRRSRLQRNGL